ncbi:MAG: hypothetical protein Q9201_006285 [Fulgogasparrea decipioides]
MQAPAAAATVSFIAPCGTSIGATTSSLRPAVYQDLIDRGWRRDKKWRKNHFDFYTAVHETESIRVPRPVDPRDKEPIQPAHQFEVLLEPDSFTEEKYALFKHYQYHVHKEGPDQASKACFKRFLCSGLGQSIRINNGRRQKLGSYHQCYRLDGRLVAMGVLDLLPDCVSSVYLIYHQDVKDWYLGKLSALREISLAIEGNYRYYYMGYYIHSCVKMRYKIQYRPSHILDLETYFWDKLDADYLARLSVRKYVSMSLERQLRLSPRKLFIADERQLDNEGLIRLQDYLQEGNASSISQGVDANNAFSACMPGIMTLDEVESKAELGRWTVKISKYTTMYLEELELWPTWNIRDPASLKGVVAELAAALGPGLVRQFVLDFAR